MLERVLVHLFDLASTPKQEITLPPILKSFVTLPPLHVVHHQKPTPSIDNAWPMTVAIEESPSSGFTTAPELEVELSVDNETPSFGDIKFY